MPDRLSPLPPGPNLTPRLIDFRSIHDARRVCISYFVPGTSNCIDITFQDFGRAVDNAAWTFSNLIGARRSSLEPTKVVGILARRYVTESAFISLILIDRLKVVQAT